MRRVRFVSGGRKVVRVKDPKLAVGTAANPDEQLSRLLLVLGRVDLPDVDE